MALFTDFFDLKGWKVKTERIGSGAEGWSVLPQALSTAASSVWLEALYKKGGVSAKTTLRDDFDQTEQEVEVSSPVKDLFSGVERAPSFSDKLSAKVAFDQKNLKKSTLTGTYEIKDTAAKHEYTVALASSFGASEPSLSFTGLWYRGTESKPKKNAYVQVKSKTSPSFNPFTFNIASTFTVAQISKAESVPQHPVLAGTQFNFEYNLKSEKAESAWKAQNTVVASLQAPVTVAAKSAWVGVSHTMKYTSNAETGKVVADPAVTAVAASIDASENVTLKVKYDVLGALYLATVLKNLPGSWQFATLVTYQKSVPTVGVSLTSEF